MKLIDADALITAVLKNAIDYAVLYGDSEMHRLLVQVIAHQPTIDIEPQWIPCSERLPETHKAGNSVFGIFMESKPVLVYGVPEYESEYSFNVVTYCDDLNGNTYWSTEMDAVTINKVTAWMPLPEPYRAERRTDEKKDI